MTLSVQEARVLVGLKVGDASRDGRLQQLIAAAYEQAARVVGPMMVRSVTETASKTGSKLFLRRRPVMAVSAVGSTTALSELFVDPPSGVVEGIPASVPDGPVKVTYTVGYAVYPASVEEGIRLWVKHRWSLESHGTQTYGDVEMDGVTDFNGLPNAVLNVWAPYMINTSSGIA